MLGSHKQQISIYSRWVWACDQGSDAVFHLSLLPFIPPHHHHQSECLSSQAKDSRSHGLLVVGSLRAVLLPYPHPEEGIGSAGYHSDWVVSGECQECNA